MGAKVPHDVTMMTMLTSSTSLKILPFFQRQREASDAKIQWSNIVQCLKQRNMMNIFGELKSRQLEVNQVLDTLHRHNS